MAARNIYRVQPNGEMWEVLKEGVLLSSHQVKANAVLRAEKFADQQISSRVLVYRPDGSIQESIFKYH